MNSLQIAEEFEEELIRMRRVLHAHPELSWEEYNTQKTIIEILSREGIEYITPYKTAVIAFVSGEKSDAASSDKKAGKKKILGIRADIDALPIQEKNVCSFTSEQDGVMHACGHDAHTAILLATAILAHRYRAEFSLDFHFLFQPAEEHIADSGAGYLKDLPAVKDCDRLIGLHVFTAFAPGIASLPVGPVMASADTFLIEIKGKGTHAAHPEHGIDPISVGVSFCQAMERVRSRELSSVRPSVISVTSFEALSNFNVIPENATLKGTCRASTPEDREKFPLILKRIAAGLSTETRAEIKVSYFPGPPVTINDAEVVKTGQNAIAHIFPKEKIETLPFITGGEDFAKYENPKAFLILGAGKKEEALRSPQHSPYFQIDESVMKYGVAYFLEYALCYQAE
jgi:amidohydrolase